MQEFIDDHDLAWLGRLAGALLGESNAADLVQDTVAATIERPIPDGVPRRAWLATVARRLAARRWRGESRRLERERMRARPEALPDDAELLERAEAVARVTAAARALPEPFRHTILLRFLADLTPEEIAKREDRPVDTVRWRVRRGLELLRRDLGEGKDDWRPALFLLLPLAPAPPGVKLLATGASSQSIGSTILGVASMKSAIALATVVICLGLWLFDEESAESVAAERSDIVTDDTDSSFNPRRTTSADLTTEDVAEATSENVAPPVEEAAERAGGRVVDELGRGVAGATVFMPAADPESQAKVVTDASGHFTLDDRTVVDVGVTANGFLRAFSRDFDPLAGQEIVLKRGAKLVGRVVDPEGQPVPGLELLAHTAGTRIDHVSPSQMQRRAKRAALKGEESPYEGCRGETDASGIIELQGLPEGEVRLRCLDPAWTLEGPIRCTAGGPFVEWTVKPSLGVRVKVAEESGEPSAESVRAVFRVDLELADGESESYEQWIGRGDGEASFSLDETLLPRLAEVRLRRVTFHGTVTSGTRTQDWRAEPLDIVEGGPRIAMVEVALKSVPLDESEDQADATAGVTPDIPTEMTTLRLDVVYKDGSPVSERLTVRWSGRGITDGVARPEPDTPGYYTVRVPATKLDLTVKEFSWSGSLSPWTDQVNFVAGVDKKLRVVLEQGGTVILQRPKDFKGTWAVHASWRPAGEEEWRGSWNYGTDEGTLRLSGLRAAEWRFRVRREEGDEDFRERTAVVSDGETLLVAP